MFTSLWSAASLVLNEVTKAKVKILGGNFDFKELIDEDVLEKRFGGKSETPTKFLHANIVSHN